MMSESGGGCGVHDRRRLSHLSCREEGGKGRAYSVGESCVDALQRAFPRVRMYVSCACGADVQAPSCVASHCEIVSL